jgi:glutathionylspermidine synthase
MVLSNKALLVLLWEAFPGHPNLLPAAFERAGVEGPAVRKPLFGREGANVEVLDAPALAARTGGPYGGGPVVYQALHRLPEFAGAYPVLGSWLVASQPAGMGIREDSSPITTNASRFVPHLFE